MNCVRWNSHLISDIAHPIDENSTISQEPLLCRIINFEFVRGTCSLHHLQYLSYRHIEIEWIFLLIPHCNNSMLFWHINSTMLTILHQRQISRGFARRVHAWRCANSGLLEQSPIISLMTSDSKWAITSRNLSLRMADVRDWVMCWETAVRSTPELSWRSQFWIHWNLNI